MIEVLSLSDDFTLRPRDAEFFASLSLIASLLAGIQAQILSLSITQPGGQYKAINTLWISGLVLDVAAAAQSLFVSWWIALLSTKTGRKLEEHGLPHIRLSLYVLNINIITTYVWSGSGALSLVAGLLVLVWTAQPTVVAILTTGVASSTVVFRSIRKAVWGVTPSYELNLS
ncbi:hypothetical protein DFH08DRAFT_819474 [Mycena albidolilacea]|uniref:Uncharacterized protein n=1 Tax=Mycena albidolilacea TaxID=1033008 RepID=A0AAD6ZEF4_9AGAR|nr:hypothetical protein DFH08DRAFT_819474 [Mycena albidolilacea]